MTIPDSYTIRLVDLPTNIEGTISESPDGHVNIYINARLNHEKRIIATKHEFEHYENDDLHNEDNIRTIEARASL